MDSETRPPSLDLDTAISSVHTTSRAPVFSRVKFPPPPQSCDKGYYMANALAHGQHLLLFNYGCIYVVPCSYLTCFFWPRSSLLESKPTDNFILNWVAVSFQSVWFDWPPPHSASVISSRSQFPCSFTHNSNNRGQHLISTSVWWTHFCLAPLLRAWHHGKAWEQASALFCVSSLSECSWRQYQELIDHKDSSSIHPRLEPQEGQWKTRCQIWIEHKGKFIAKENNLDVRRIFLKSYSF